MKRDRPAAAANFTRRERRYGYIYLVNIIIPVTFLSLFPLKQALFGGMLIAAFVGVYLLSFKARRSRLILVFLQILIMLALMAYLNEAYIWMIFYPSACIGIFFERRFVFLMVGFMAAVLIAENYVMSLFHGYVLADWLMILAAVVAGIATCFGTIWQSETIKSREQLRNANLQIERLTKIAERERISRDLHDVMGHELSMITLKSQLAYKLIERDSDRAKSEIRDIESAARLALTRVREYIADIRQPNFREEWDDAIKLLQAAGITSEAEACPIDGGISNGSIQAIAMCLREAITNLVRYSDASRCKLKIHQENDSLYLTICDNGKGVLSLAKDTTSHGGNGINSMRARIASVQGKLTLWSNEELIGETKTKIRNPSPWSTGVALLIEVPSETSSRREEDSR